jgi:hypothetical protein
MHRTKSWAVGRTSTEGGVLRFDTQADAEAFIGQLEIIFPEETHRGDFYVDSPEEEANV